MKLGAYVVVLISLALISMTLALESLVGKKPLPLDTAMVWHPSCHIIHFPGFPSTHILFGH